LKHELAQLEGTGRIFANSGEWVKMNRPTVDRFKVKKYLAFVAAIISAAFFFVGVAGLSSPWLAADRFGSSFAHPGFALRWMIFFGVACCGGVAGFCANAKWFASKRANG